MTWFYWQTVYGLVHLAYMSDSSTAICGRRITHRWVKIEAAKVTCSGCLKFRDAVELRRRE